MHNISASLSTGLFPFQSKSFKKSYLMFLNCILKMLKMENFVFFIFFHSKKKLSKLKKKKRKREKRNECPIHAASQRQTLSMPWKQGRSDPPGYLV